ncbi:MAG: AMP-binding protein, partial [Mycobacteriaceae bacterium]
MSTTSYCHSLSLFREYAQSDPHRVAVSFAPKNQASKILVYKNISYQDLETWSDSLAHNFFQKKITKGTRTIVLVTPGPELYAILLALFKIGAVPVIIDPGMGLRRMLRCLSAVDPQAFIGIPQAHAVRVLFKRTFLGIQTKVTVGRRWFWGGQKLQPLEKSSAPPFISEYCGTDDELLMIAFTTGSTGPAKAVEMTHGNLSAMVKQTQLLAQRKEIETSLVTLPMFGVLDLILGSSIVLPPLTPSAVGATDPEHVVDAINRFSVQTMFASPAVLVPLLSYAREHTISLPSIRAIFSGGAPVPEHVVIGLREILGKDAKVYAGYGSTEALPISAIESRELLNGLTDRSQTGAGT